MTAQLRRGSVVAYGVGKIGLVWDSRPDSVTLFPIRVLRAERAGDAPIDALADQLVSRARAGAAVQPRFPRTVRRDTVDLLGEASGQLDCRVNAAVARLAAAAAQKSKWNGDRLHRQRALPEKSAVR